MNLFNILLLLVLIFIVFVIYKILKPKTIYLNEQYIGIDEPIPLHGRPDKVSFLGNKLLIEELKTRNRSVVYESDIWQMSIYRYILCYSQKREVMDYGIVWIKLPNKKDFVRKEVKLKSLKDVEGLYYRYLKLKNKDIIPVCTKNRNFCKHCSHYNTKCFPDIKR